MEVVQLKLRAICVLTIKKLEQTFTATLKIQCREHSKLMSNELEK